MEGPAAALRILCALAVLATSSGYSIATYRAASHHLFTPGFAISLLIFVAIGVLSFPATFFVLGVPKP
jgi:hypothetical protein